MKIVGLHLQNQGWCPGGGHATPPAIAYDYDIALEAITFRLSG